jgi:peptidoglycan glycosyltransferase
MNRAIRRLAAGLLLTYLALAAGAGYWNTVRAPELLAHEDNPRPIEQRRRIARGAILARDGTPLAVAEPDSDPGTWRRGYPFAVTVPAVGYASLKHGTAGLEDSYDDVLVGLEGGDPLARAWAETIHRLPAGRAIRLTLDPALQLAADRALGARRGAVVVLDARSGDVLALVSHPTFDPGALDEQFEALSQDPAAPLLERATQGAYQPGPVLQPFLLAAARERGTIAMSEVITGAGLPLALGLDLRCAAPAPRDLAGPAALAAACPGYFAALGERLGAPALDALFETLGFYDAPEVPVRVFVSDRPPLPAGGEVLQRASAGQGELTLSPLHVALATAALAGDGALPAPRLVAAVERPEGGWAPVLKPPGRPAFAAATAAELREALLAAVSGPGPAAGAATDGLSVAGHAGVALVGGGNGQPRGQAWFTGFAAQAGDPPGTLVVTVLVEQSDDPRTAAEIAGAIFATQRP